MKKFELTTDFKMFNEKKLFRIKALIDFGDVKAGELGGYVEKKNNLSQDGNAWIWGDANVCGNAKVYGDAKAWGNTNVCGNAEVYGDTKVYGDAKVWGNANVCENADRLWITGLGTQGRTTTAFRCTDSIVRIKCGCFYGTLEEFKKQVTKTRTGKVQAEYLKFAELIEIYFGIDKEAEKNE